ncbi:thiazole synthase [Salmonella enterica subsp. arizonae]|uniref:thiazole synthase n=1 Tax=Salmonella enterica subsp. arizonae TaxID=59203 RepID=A0A379S9G2_SALER|nr:thiazole synthase [Salmonella enterica subsp. arizonae]
MVLPYCGADPVLCKRLEDVGCAAVMPLGAPIGSNQGLETRAMLEIIIQQATVPVVVDAGIGVPSHAVQALEMGADAVLVNTAIAVANDPVMMANAFRLAVEAAYWLARLYRVIAVSMPAPPARSPDSWRYLHENVHRPLATTGMGRYPATHQQQNRRRCGACAECFTPQP